MRFICNKAKTKWCKLKRSDGTYVCNASKPHTLTDCCGKRTCWNVRDQREVEIECVAHLPTEQEESK